MMEAIIREVGRTIKFLVMEDLLNKIPIIKETLNRVRRMEKEIIRIFKKLIPEVGKMIKDRELEKNNLKMQKENIQEILLMINIKVKANLWTNNTFMKVILKMDSLMVKE
jgi:hypothetical protein